jgi:hypothetical protein
MGLKDGLFSLLLFCLHRVIIHELDEAPRVLVGMYRADLSEAVRDPLLDMVWYDYRHAEIDGVGCVRIESGDDYMSSHQCCLTLNSVSALLLML